MKIVFLGTAASIPTRKRALSCVAVQRQGELFLFDCGEGSQRQMIQAKIGFNRRTKVFITHMHGDHILGLPGLLQTMSLLGRTKPIQIYGPNGIFDFLEAMHRTAQFSLRFSVVAFEIESEELILKEKEYEVYSAQAEHSIPSLAYALIEKPRPGRFYPEKASILGVPKGRLWAQLQQGNNIKLADGSIIKSADILDSPRPGRKIVYVGDTRPSDRIVEFAREADILIHEATFADELAERAEKDKHSTPIGAAQVARKASVKLLVVTHISARYNDTMSLLKEAKRIFPNVVVAEDFMRLDIPFKELHKED